MAIPEKDAQIEVPFGKSHVDITINTQLKGGPSEFPFQLTYYALESKKWGYLQGNVKMHVSRGLVAAPSFLSLSSTEIALPLTVDILDDFPGEYAITRIELSEPAKVHARVLDLGTGNERPIEDRGYIREFRVRRQLRVQLDSALGTSAAHHWVRVYCNYPEAAPLEVPIHITAPRPIVALSPHVLNIRAFRPDDTRERSVMLSRVNSWTEEPKASYPSDLCSVEISPGSDGTERLARIKFSPDSLGRSFEIRFLVADREVAKLPIVIHDRHTPMGDFHSQLSEK
jgi:hypothetical protein